MAGCLPLSFGVLPLTMTGFKSSEHWPLPDERPLERPPVAFPLLFDVELPPLEEESPPGGVPLDGPPMPGGGPGGGFQG